MMNLDNFGVGPTHEQEKKILSCNNFLINYSAEIVNFAEHAHDDLRRSFYLIICPDGNFFFAGRVFALS